MANVTCRSCGKRYDYSQHDCCPDCGAYNRAPERDELNDADSARRLSDADCVKRKNAEPGKVCFEEKKTCKGKTRSGTEKQKPDWHRAARLALFVGLLMFVVSFPINHRIPDTAGFVGLIGYMLMWVGIFFSIGFSTTEQSKSMKKKAGKTGRGKKSYKETAAKQPPGYYVAFTFLVIASLGMTVFISGLYLLILGASLEKAGILINPIFEVYINYTVMRFGETMLMLLKPRVLIIMAAAAGAFRILYPKLAGKKKE